MNRLKKSRDISTTIGILAVVIFAAVFYTLNQSFLNAFNVQNLLTDMSPLLVMATGVTFIIIIGSTDLSIGATCSLASVLFVRFAPVFGGWIYLIVLGFGFISGLIVGTLQARMKVPSFIASLGLMSIWESLALVFSNSGTIQLNPRQWYTIDWMAVKIGLVPCVFFLAIVVSAVYFFIQNYTGFGKYVFSIGANERAAWILGVPVQHVKILCYAIAGVCYALGGIMFVAKLVSGGPNVGDSYTLLSIASVALGGTSMAGGKGSVVKTLIGVALAIVVRNGMTVVGIDSFWQKIVYGSVIIVAAYLTSEKKNKEQIIK